MYAASLADLRAHCPAHLSQHLMTDIVGSDSIGTETDDCSLGILCDVSAA